MIKASEYAECSYCIGRFAAGLVTPDQFKTGERIALDIVLPKLDNDADAVAEAVKNKGRRSHGTSARSNAVTEIKTAIVKKSRTLSCSPENRRLLVELPLHCLRADYWLRFIQATPAN